MSHGSEDTASYVDGATTANITRLDKATPPLTGTFSAEIYGGVAEGSAHRPPFVFTLTEMQSKKTSSDLWLTPNMLNCHLVLTGSYYSALNGIYGSN